MCECVWLGRGGERGGQPARAVARRARGVRCAVCGVWCAARARARACSSDARRASIERSSERSFRSSPGGGKGGGGRCVALRAQGLHGFAHGGGALTPSLDTHPSGTPHLAPRAPWSPATPASPPSCARPRPLPHAQAHTHTPKRHQSPGSTRAFVTSATSFSTFARSPSSPRASRERRDSWIWERRAWAAATAAASFPWPGEGGRGWEWCVFLAAWAEMPD